MNWHDTAFPYLEMSWFGNQLQNFTRLINCRSIEFSYHFKYAGWPTEHLASKLKRKIISQIPHHFWTQNCVSWNCGLNKTSIRLFPSNYPYLLSSALLDFLNLRCLIIVGRIRGRLESTCNLDITGKFNTTIQATTKSTRTRTTKNSIT